MMAAPNESAAAVFLDRDGTLMREVNYCSEPGQVEIFPGVPEALVRLKAAGYKLIVISNQAGIGRGYFTEAQYRLVEAEVATSAPGKIRRGLFLSGSSGTREHATKTSPGYGLGGTARS